MPTYLKDGPLAPFIYLMHLVEKKRKDKGYNIAGLIRIIEDSENETSKKTTYRNIINGGRELLDKERLDHTDRSKNFSYSNLNVFCSYATEGKETSFENFIETYKNEIEEYYSRNYGVSDKPFLDNFFNRGKAQSNNEESENNVEESEDTNKEKDHNAPRCNLSYESLSNMSREDHNNCIHCFLSYIKKDPKNDIAYYWLGVLFLKNNEFKKAIIHLNTSIEINPMNAEYWYNLGIAMFEGKRPFRLKFNEIKEILTILKTALNLDMQQGKYYCLQYLIIKDYYIRRGLDSSGESLKELLYKIKNLQYQKYELERLLYALGLPQETSKEFNTTLT